MALPVPDDLLGLDYVHKGQPFVDAPAKSTIDTTGLDYVHKGQPFNPNAPSGEAENYELTVQDLSFALTLDAYSFTQIHALSPADLAHGFPLDASTINQNHVIATQDVQHALSGDSTTIAQLHVLVPDDIALALITDNDAIDQDHIIETQDIALALSTDNTTVDRNYVVETQDLSLALTEDDTTIAQNHVLATDDIALAFPLENTTIAQNHILAPDDIGLALITDNDSMEQDHVLAPADLSHGFTVEGVTLEIQILTGTYEVVAVLPADDTDLANALTPTELSYLANDDDVYFDWSGIGYIVKMFRSPNDNNTEQINVRCRVKSTLAPSDSPIYLQAYNHDTSSWVTIDSDGVAAANEEIWLRASIVTSVEDYYNGVDNEVTARIFQEVA